MKGERRRTLVNELTLEMNVKVFAKNLSLETFQLNRFSFIASFSDNSENNFFDWRVRYSINDVTF